MTRRSHAWSAVRAHLPALLFWTTALLVLVPRLGAYGLEGAEDRWAAIVREMRSSGDWFHPTRNGVSYFDKPLLSYWLIGLVAAIADRLDEAILRVPSVVAALVTLATTIHLGRRLGTEREARTAGWLLLATFGILVWARKGEADMLNLASILLAVAWYWRRRERPGFASYMGLYAICFIGSQAKGLVAFVVPMLVILPDLLHGQRWRAHLRLSHLLAFAIGVGLFLLPLAIADRTATEGMESGLALAFHESAGRYVRPWDHTEPFYVYFLYVPVLAFPWIPLGFGVARRVWSRWSELRWPDRWLISATLLVFGFFTVSGSRRLYYILPILPFLALLGARFLPSTSRSRALRAQFWLLVAFSVLELLSPVLWPVLERRVGFVAPQFLVFATFGIGALSLLALFTAGRGPRLSDALGVDRHLTPLLCSAVLLSGGLITLQKPTLERYRETKPFVLAVRERAREIPTRDLAFYDRPTPSNVVFYLDRPEPIASLAGRAELLDFLASNEGTRVLLLRTGAAAELRDALPTGWEVVDTLAEATWPWSKPRDIEKRSEAWVVRHAG